MVTLVGQFFLTVIPCLIVGAIAYYFFKNYLKDADQQRWLALRKETKKELIPYRIQALERLALFMERIDPRQLLIRIKPADENKTAYAGALIEVIEQEYQHNVAQQIYVSDACWNAIKTSKNITINMIRNLSVDQKIETADQLRKEVLIKMEEQEPPSSVGLQFIKREASQMW